VGECSNYGNGGGFGPNDAPPGGPGLGGGGFGARPPPAAGAPPAYDHRASSADGSGSGSGSGHPMDSYAPGTQHDKSWSSSYRPSTSSASASRGYSAGPAGAAAGPAGMVIICYCIVISFAIVEWELECRMRIIRLIMYNL